MREFQNCFGLIALVGTLSFAAAPTRAATDIAWVSADGTDAGTTCAFSAPCLTAQYAHDQTDAGGAIYFRTSGDFGAVTIAKSIAIVAEGVTAHTGAIVVGAGTGIVHLRGLTVETTAAVTAGIRLNSAKALHIHACVVRASGSNSFGLEARPAAASKLYVSDSTFHNNGASGIYVDPSGTGAVMAMIDRVRLVNNGVDGITTSANSDTVPITVVVRDSVASGNGSAGFYADNYASSSNGVVVMIERSAATNNDTGVDSNDFGTVIRVSESTISGNDTGVFTGSEGSVELLANNIIGGNGDDSVDTLSARRTRR